jgi:hypothetical protein
MIDIQVTLKLSAAKAALGDFEQQIKKVKTSVDVLNSALGQTKTEIGDIAKAIKGLGKLPTITGLFTKTTIGNISKAATGFKDVADQLERAEKAAVKLVGHIANIATGAAAAAAAAVGLGNIPTGGARRGSGGIGNPAKNPWMNLLMRSRVSSSGNMMPLVMDIAKILGPRVTAIAAIALTAIKLGVRLIGDAAKAMGDWRRPFVMGGGSPSDARNAARLQAFGIDVIGMGKNTMSGYGPIAAAAAGVNPFGGPFGDNDYSKKGLKELDWIRNSRNFNVARRRAELTGSPEAADAFLLNPDVYDRLAKTKNIGMGQMKDSANFDANMVSIADSFSRLKVALAGPFINTIASGLGHVADAAEKLAPALNFLASLLNPFNLSGLLPNSSNDDNTRATNKNTDAVNNLSNMINPNAGSYGGYGSGGRGSVAPSRYHPAYYGNNAQLGNAGMGLPGV